MNTITTNGHGFLYYSTTGTTSTAGNFIIQTPKVIDRVVTRIDLFTSDDELWGKWNDEEFPLHCDKPLEGESTHDILRAFLEQSNMCYLSIFHDFIVDLYLDGKLIGQHVFTIEEFKGICEEIKAKVKAQKP